MGRRKLAGLGLRVDVMGTQISNDEIKTIEHSPPDLLRILSPGSLHKGKVFVVQTMKGISALHSG